MNGYELSKGWFDFAFENPEKINPSHAAIYFFAIEHCNRLGWKTKFGMPSQMAMDAVGIRKHETYIRYFNDLCEWGFFEVIERSRNQWSANIISLGNAIPKNGEALGKAIRKHGGKQTQCTGESNGESRGESKGCIDKPLTLEPSTTKRRKETPPPPPTIDEVIAYFKEKGYTEASARKAYDYYQASVTETKRHWSDGKGQPVKNWKMKMNSVWFKDENKYIEQSGSLMRRSVTLPDGSIRTYADITL
jgi:hypothetical protein